MNALDLQAHRCPTAMSLARQAVMKFVETARDGELFAIQTIEPSFNRDLKLFLNSEAPTLSIIKTMNGAIPDGSKEAWLDDFDEEEWDNCEQHCFIMKFTSSS